jgi:hypothetical protein
MDSRNSRGLSARGGGGGGGVEGKDRDIGTERRATGSILWLVLLGMEGVGGGFTLVKGVDNSERGRACNPPTHRKEGRKYHYDRTHARKWPSPVYVLPSLCIRE